MPNKSPDVSSQLKRLLEAERAVLSKPLSREELAGFSREAPKIPNPKPFIKFTDLNNTTDKDIYDCNPERHAINVGLEWSF